MAYEQAPHNKAGRPDLTSLVINSLGEVEGRFEIHKHIHNLIESKKISLREGLYGVYSPRIWAE